MKNKIVSSFAEAVKDIPDGASVMMHSFAGSAGIPQNLILALRDHDAKNLTVISCSMGVMPTAFVNRPGFTPYVTPNLLVESKQVAKVITTWAVGSMSSGTSQAETPVQKAIEAGEVEWEPLSQGILAERIRAGAADLGGFYTPVGIGTLLEKGKEKRVIDGREYIFQKPLRADFGFVRAYRSDTQGNLIYQGTCRSFNPLIAMACKVTIAEVEEIVDPSEMDPEGIVTPGLFIDRIVQIPGDGLK
jgi:3-oxoacid CoA-transferase A subunit